MIIKVNVEAFVNERIKKGFSQRSLAKASGLSGALISQIENEERNPSPNSANKLCEALNVKFEEIFFTQNVSNSKHQTA
jgi:transcriptional regulator with XRE-family HTH domain